MILNSGNTIRRYSGSRTLLAIVLMCLSLVTTRVRSFSPNLQQRTAISKSSITRLSAVTIEREDIMTLPKVEAEPEVTTVEERRSGSEAWEVRIYNDGLNTREHVARSLVQVTGLSELQAYSTMMLAHRAGMAAVGQWVYEIAEMYHDALRNKGIICDIIPVDDMQ